METSDDQKFVHEDLDSDVQLNVSEEDSNDAPVLKKRKRKP